MFCKRDEDGKTFFQSISCQCWDCAIFQQRFKDLGHFPWESELICSYRHVDSSDLDRCPFFVQGHEREREDLPIKGTEFLL